MPPLTIDKYEQLRDNVAIPPRITYTDLARGKEWRSTLPEQGVIGIDDKGSTPAWLLSDEYMEGLLGLVDELLHEREEHQIQAMLDARSEYQNWCERDELKAKAMASFRNRKNAMRAAIDGD